MALLTHANSPLDQARRYDRASLASAADALSADEQATLARVLHGKYETIHNEVFDLPQDEAMRIVFDEAPPIPEPSTDWYHPVMDSYIDTSRQPSSQGTVLLTAKEERALFLKYNYCRFRVLQIRERVLEQDPIDADDARDLLHWHERAERLREQIADTNLALVLAMAKRTRMSEVDFADLVSEGNMALLRAVDKFDVARGFKFSTYSCRAILKAFSRQGVKLSKHRQMFPTDFDPKLERSDYARTRRAEHEDDCVDEVRRIIRENKAELSDIEREVIHHRFGVDPTGRTDAQQNPMPLPPVTTPALNTRDRGSSKHRVDHQPLTLEQVGKIIGVTKERVRQIQNKALEKIRLQLEDDFLV